MKILTAVAPDTAERVGRILTGHDLLLVADLAHAKAALETAGIGLIFVGARFDESRMFDFLDYIRRDAEHRKLPIVAAIVGATTMSSATVDGLEHTTKIFGASVFFNLNDFSDDEIGNSRLRMIVDTLLVPPQDVAAVKAKLDRG